MSLFVIRLLTKERPIPGPELEDTDKPHEIGLDFQGVQGAFSALRAASPRPQFYLGVFGPQTFPQTGSMFLAPGAKWRAPDPDEWALMPVRGEEKP